MIEEIMKAQMERVRDFGYEHRITEWPLNDAEWAQLLEDRSEDPRSGDRMVQRLMGTERQVVIRTPVGSIRLFRGP